MVKIVFITSFFLITFYFYGQTGINTQSPTETLDVNGNLRVRGISANVGNPDTDRAVVADANGVLNNKYF